MDLYLEIVLVCANGHEPTTHPPHACEAMGRHRGHLLRMPLNGVRRAGQSGKPVVNDG